MCRKYTISFFFLKNSSTPKFFKLFPELKYMMKRFIIYEKIIQGKIEEAEKFLYFTFSPILEAPEFKILQNHYSYFFHFSIARRILIDIFALMKQKFYDKVSDLFFELINCKSLTYVYYNDYKIKRNNKFEYVNKYQTNSNTNDINNNIKDLNQDYELNSKMKETFSDLINTKDHLNKDHSENMDEKDEKGTSNNNNISSSYHQDPKIIFQDSYFTNPKEKKKTNTNSNISCDNIFSQNINNVSTASHNSNASINKDSSDDNKNENCYYYYTNELNEEFEYVFDSALNHCYFEDVQGFDFLYIEKELIFMIIEALNRINLLNNFIGNYNNKANNLSNINDLSFDYSGITEDYIIMAIDRFYNQIQSSFNDNKNNQNILKNRKYSTRVYSFNKINNNENSANNFNIENNIEELYNYNNNIMVMNDLTVKIIQSTLNEVLIIYKSAILIHKIQNLMIQDVISSLKFPDIVILKQLIGSSKVYKTAHEHLRYFVIGKDAINIVSKSHDPLINTNILLKSNILNCHSYKAYYYQYYNNKYRKLGLDKNTNDEEMNKNKKNKLNNLNNLINTDSLKYINNNSKEDSISNEKKALLKLKQISVNLKPFNFNKIIKKENLDKIIIRRFRNYIKYYLSDNNLVKIITYNQNREEIVPLIDINQDSLLKFVFNFVILNLIPPCNYSDLSFKSFNLKYLIWLFEDSGMRVMYEMFEEEFGEKICDIICRDYDISTDLISSENSNNNSKGNKNNKNYSSLVKSIKNSGNLVNNNLTNNNINKDRNDSKLEESRLTKKQFLLYIKEFSKIYSNNAHNKEDISKNSRNINSIQENINNNLNLLKGEILKLKKTESIEVNENSCYECMHRQIKNESEYCENNNFVLNLNKNINNNNNYSNINSNPVNFYSLLDEDNGKEKNVNTYDNADSNIDNYNYNAFYNNQSSDNQYMINFLDNNDNVSQYSNNFNNIFYDTDKYFNNNLDLDNQSEISLFKNITQ